MVDPEEEITEHLEDLEDIEDIRLLSECDFCGEQVELIDGACPSCRDKYPSKEMR